MNKLHKLHNRLPTRRTYLLMRKNNDNIAMVFRKLIQEKYRYHEYYIYINDTYNFVWFFYRI
jgi:hypothetical protein